jgi:hypothetical protein
MKYIFIFFFFIAISFSDFAQAGSGSAEEMISSCKPITQAKIFAQDIELPSDFGSGYCWGAFVSLQKATRLTEFGKHQPLLGICAPPESTLTQLISIFTEYAGFVAQMAMD